MKKVCRGSICIILMIFLGCSDKVNFNLDDVEQHAWMKPFVHSPFSFSGSHNLDESRIVFSFKTEVTIDEYFKRVDSLAIIDDWSIPFKCRNYRVFVRNTFGEVADSVPIIVKIHSLDSGFIIVDIR